MRRSSGEKAAFKGSSNGLLAMIGDDDTITGLLLAGCGNVDEKKQKNFLVVDASTRADRGHVYRALSFGWGAASRAAR